MKSGGTDPTTPIPRSRCVFVGNIPYDATEQQLTDIFQEVGPVVNFRLVFDRETGKARGYGFCEYRDAETALSAMRNLNNFELNGRPLRVDFAETEKSAPGAAGSVSGEGRGRNNPDQVAGVMEELTIHQVYDVVVEMKALINSNVDNARQILINNPQLAYALLQAQLILGMITPTVLQRVIQMQPPSIPQPQASIPTQNQGMPPQNIGFDGGPRSMPGVVPGMNPMSPNTQISGQPMSQVGYGSYGGGGGPGSVGIGGFSQGPLGHGPGPMGPGQGQVQVQQPQPQPQPPQQPQQQQQQQGAGSPATTNPAVAQLLNLPSLDEKQRSLLQQVLQLTPQQLENLPPAQRQQVEGLLNVLRSGGLTQ